jgi:methyl-accepting chemotaxis protein
MLPFDKGIPLSSRCAQAPETATGIAHIPGTGKNSEPEAVDSSREANYNTAVLTELRKKKTKIKVGFRRRMILRRSLLKVLGLQTLALLAAGGALYNIVSLDFVKEFYSAHRSLGSLQNLLLPALLISGGAAFLLMALVTWLGFRSYSRKLIGPIQRVEKMLQRLAGGDLSYDPTAVPASERWSLDDSADEMLTAYRDRLAEAQRLSRDVHNAVLSLRYKATAGDTLTLQELREMSVTLDVLCKQLTASIKWFEI